MRKYRKDFSEVLSSSNSNMTRSRFLRLFILSMVLLAIVFPLDIYILYRNASFPLLPYSWVAVHGPDWNTIDLIPTGGIIPFDRWIMIAVGFTVFPFFGLGHDAMIMYRRWLLKMGFGKIFPCLCRESSSRHSANSPTSSHANSVGSRVRLLFHKKQSGGTLFSW